MVDETWSKEVHNVSCCIEISVYTWYMLQSCYEPVQLHDYWEKSLIKTYTRMCMQIGVAIQTIPKHSQVWANPNYTVHVQSIPILKQTLTVRIFNYFIYLYYCNQRFH